MKITENKKFVSEPAREWNDLDKIVVPWIIPLLMKQFHLEKKLKHPSIIEHYNGSKSNYDDNQAALIQFLLSLIDKQEQMLTVWVRS